jgi:hypothetical protein
MALLRTSLKRNPSFLANACNATHCGLLIKTVMRFMQQLYDIHAYVSSIKSREMLYVG